MIAIGCYFGADMTCNGEVSVYFVLSDRSLSLAGLPSYVSYVASRLGGLLKGRASEGCVAKCCSRYPADDETRHDLTSGCIA